jgi:hypothetical protein
MINAVTPEIIEDEPMPAWLEVQLLESLEQVRQGKTISIQELDANLDLFIKELIAQ